MMRLPIDMMKRMLREPLLHFLLLGGVLFVVYSGMQKPGSSGEPGKIVITQGQIEHLATGFAKAWQRSPSPQELEGLIRDQVREEVYYREAIALGLDKNDTVIRRRLRQKIEFVSEDIVAHARPTEADLNAFFQAHADAFRLEPRLTFRQVFLNPKKHGEYLARDTVQLIADLNQVAGMADPATLGDSILLEHQFTDAPISEIAKQFGEKFAKKLLELKPGQWWGPVESGYGAHLVSVSELTEARMPALADVRDAVLREWDNARRLEANEKFYQELLKRYTVTIEQPAPDAVRKIAATTQK